MDAKKRMSIIIKGGTTLSLIYQEAYNILKTWLESCTVQAMSLLRRAMGQMTQYGRSIPLMHGGVFFIK